jgi:hypothetical protein
MAVGEHLQLGVDARQQSRHGGLGRARVAEEHHVARAVGDGHARGAPHLLGLELRDQPVHLLLDGLEPDQLVELRHRVADLDLRDEQVELGVVAVRPHGHRVAVGHSVADGRSRLRLGGPAPGGALG